MALTVAQLAVELRVHADPDTAPAEPLLGTVTRLQATAVAMISARTAGAPEALQDQATIAIAGYLLDRPAAAQGGRFANVWKNSGAASMLAEFVVRRAGAIGDGAAASSSTGTGPAGPAVDAEAREDAAEALAAAQANARAIAGLERSGGVVDQTARDAADAARAAIPAKATNGDVDGESDDADYMTVAKTFRAIARRVRAASTTATGTVTLARNEDVDATETDTSRVPDLTKAKRLIERLVPAWARAASPPAAGTTLPAYAQSETRGLLSRAGSLFWEALNLVPNGPGEASRVGEVLAVTGEDDDSYAWRRLSQLITLAAGGGLRFDGSGALETSPSLVAAAAQADAALLGLDVQSVTVATAQSYQNTLNSQRTATGALILVTTAAISGNRGGSAYSWPAGQVLWYPPKSDAGEPLFVLTAGGRAALTAEQLAKLAGITRNDETAATNAADTALGRRIDALATVADPGFVPTYWVKDEAARTITVRLDPGAIVAGDAKVRMTIQGVPVGTVALAANQHTYGFNVSAANAGTITRAAGNAGEANVPVTVEILGAGDAVTRTQKGLLHVVAQATPTGGGGGEWHWIGFASFSANSRAEAVNMRLRTFDVDGATDAAGLRAKVLDGTVKHFSVSITQVFPDASGSDGVVNTIPNHNDLKLGLRPERIWFFPGWADLRDPRRYSIEFTPDAITVTPSTATPNVGSQIRLGVFA